MLIRHFAAVATFAVALVALTLTPASAQPTAGTRLGVPASVLAQALAGSDGGVQNVRESDRRARSRNNRRWRGNNRRWRGNNRRWRNRLNRHNRRWRYRNRPSIQLYIAPRQYYSAPRSSSRCNRWSDACVANWGYDNADYYGCLRYHGCY